MSVIRARFRAVSGEGAKSRPLIQLGRFRAAPRSLSHCHASQRRRRKWGVPVPYGLGPWWSWSRRPTGCARRDRSLEDAGPRRAPLLIVASTQLLVRVSAPRARPMSRCCLSRGRASAQRGGHDPVGLDVGSACGARRWRAGWRLARCPPEHSPSLWHFRPLLAGGLGAGRRRRAWNGRRRRVVVWLERTSWRGVACLAEMGTPPKDLDVYFHYCTPLLLPQTIASRRTP